MAIVNVKSAQKTTIDGGGVVNSKVSNAFVRAAVATLEVTSGNTAESVYRFFEIPSSARVHNLEFSNDALGDSTKVNVGLYQTARNGGAAATVSAASFAANLQTVSAAERVNLTHLVTNIANIEKPVWELLGLDKDPNITYDLCATAKVNIGTSGTMSMKAEWVE